MLVNLFSLLKQTFSMYISGVFLRVLMQISEEYNDSKDAL